MTRVLLIQRLFPHYRKAVFDRLAQRFQLKLLHASGEQSIKTTDADYAEKVGAFRYTKSDTHMVMRTGPATKEFQPEVIIHELAIGIFSLHTSLWYARRKGVPFVLWGHGYDRIKGFDPKKNWSDRIRLSLYQRADAVLLYSEAGKQALAPFIPQQKLFVAPNTLDTPRLAAVRAELEQESKASRKERLGFTSDFNLIYIGRLLASKRADQLLDLVKTLRQRGFDVTGHLIGDGPDRHDLMTKVKTDGLYDHIRFHGALYDEHKIGDRLLASDLMVMPGDLGLSVNHAHHFGLPVVSLAPGPEGPFHGPEAGYVKNHRTGYLAEDLEDMADFTAAYLDDRDKQEAMQVEIERYCREVHSLDNMVAGFERVVAAVTGKGVVA